MHAINPDAGDDASPDGDGPPMSTVVQLTVLTQDFDGLPDTGAIAVFQDPSGLAVFDGLVDATGHAQADLPAGGTVTVIHVDDSGATSRTVTMTTITGVRPGDQLTVGNLRSNVGFTGAPTAMTAQFTPYAANYTYELYTACGSTGGALNGSIGSAQLALFDACHGATFDVLAVANPTAGGDVRYVFVPNATYAPNGTIAIPNQWQSVNNFTATLANVPTNLSDLLVTRSGYMGDVIAAPVAVDVPSPPSGVTSATAGYAPELGTRALVEVGLHNANASGFQLVDVTADPVGSSEGVDLAKLQLPWIVGAPTETVTGVAWDQLDGGTPDVRLVSWLGHWPDGGKTTFVNWTIEDGGATTSITLPTLPATRAPYDPGKATGVVFGKAAIIYLDYANLDGYAAARRYGPNLAATIQDLSAFGAMPIQRRLSRTAFGL